MYQNKRGKQIAEVAGDQGSAAEGWMRQQEAIKQAIIAAENGNIYMYSVTRYDACV